MHFLLFVCDIIEDGFPIFEIIFSSEKAAGELELLEMKEDLRHFKCCTKLLL